MIYKLYNDETLKVLVPQGSSPQFIGLFKKEWYDEWKGDPDTITLGCGCTSMSINKQSEQITFTIQAPSFGTNLSQPYLKSVTPRFKSKKTDVSVVWEIKFNVNPEK